MKVNGKREICNGDGVGGQREWE